MLRRKGLRKGQQNLEDSQNAKTLSTRREKRAPLRMTLLEDGVSASLTSGINRSKESTGRGPPPMILWSLDTWYLMLGQTETDRVKELKSGVLNVFIYYEPLFMYLSITNPLHIFYITPASTPSLDSSIMMVGCYVTACLQGSLLVILSGCTCVSVMCKWCI